jgi:hypothetical protein
MIPGYEPTNVAIVIVVSPPSPPPLLLDGRPGWSFDECFCCRRPALVDIQDIPGSESNLMVIFSLNNDHLYRINAGFPSSSAQDRAWSRSGCFRSCGALTAAMPASFQRLLLAEPGATSAAAIICRCCFPFASACSRRIEHLQLAMAAGSRRQPGAARPCAIGKLSVTKAQMP